MTMKIKNHYRLNSVALFTRQEEQEREDPLKIVYLSVEGSITEKCYFQFIHKYRQELGIKRSVTVKVLERNDDNSAPLQVLELLESGVEKGKQFPFRYWSALNAIKTSYPRVPNEGLIEESLNRCLDKSMANFPKLKGKTICLSDNSGSAWDTLTTEYGSTKVAEIDNLSSVMTAFNSDEGQVGIFGDDLKIVDINKRDGVLSQTAALEPISKSIGGSTENGIWLFFDKAIKEKLHYDNIFIYSDQQAGHGGLYGINSREYRNYLYGDGSRYIDVLALAQEYRRKVNPKVNIFSVQTAGYDNSVMPENEYRTSILTGWTGNEAIYAKALIDIWNQMEPEKQDKVEKVSNIKIKTSPKSCK